MNTLTSVTIRYRQYQLAPPTPVQSNATPPRPLSNTTRPLPSLLQMTPSHNTRPVSRPGHVMIPQTVTTASPHTQQHQLLPVARRVLATANTAGTARRIDDIESSPPDANHMQPRRVIIFGDERRTAPVSRQPPEDISATPTPSQ